MDQGLLDLAKQFMPKPPRTSPAFSVEAVEGGWLIAIGETGGFGLSSSRRIVATTPVQLVNYLKAWLAQCEIDEADELKAAEE